MASKITTLEQHLDYEAIIQIAEIDDQDLLYLNFDNQALGEASSSFLCLRFSCFLCWGGSRARGWEQSKGVGVEQGGSNKARGRGCNKSRG